MYVEILTAFWTELSLLSEITASAFFDSKYSVKFVIPLTGGVSNGHI
jgi:hypothetical protein